MAFILLDTETGGIKPESSSLLSIYLLAVDNELEPMKELQLKVRPKDKVYKVHPDALRINKIDLVEHDKKAIPYNDGAFLIKNFLAEFKRDTKITTGWNLDFDLDFIFYYLFSEEDWKKWMGYRDLDLQSVNLFLSTLGLSKMGSLESTARHHGLEIKDTHTEKGDVLLCLELMKKFQEITKKSLVNSQ